MSNMEKKLEELEHWKRIERWFVRTERQANEVMGQIGLLMCEIDFLQESAKDLELASR